MTNSQNREWVESALRFWTGRKPDRHTNLKLIAWNIEQLTKMQERLA